MCVSFDTDCRYPSWKIMGVERTSMLTDNHIEQLPDSDLILTLWLRSTMELFVIKPLLNVLYNKREDQAT